jgi:hypothetical protein
VQLEQLETRLVPTVAANDLYVASLYQSLLGRGADAGGLAYWTGQLVAGASPTRVAAQVAGSFEGLSRDVQQFYTLLLNRPADANGYVSMLTELESGSSLDQIKAGILGSDEFFNNAGASNDAFLKAIYLQELGRPADVTGLAAWENALTTGESRTQVVDQLLASHEASQVKVTSLYTNVLGRNPDAAGLNTWSGQLAAEANEFDVLASLFGSAEYAAKVQHAAATTPDTDANMAALDMFAHDALFTSPTSNAEYLVRKAPLPVAPPASNQCENYGVPPDADPPTGNIVPDGSGNNNSCGDSANLPCPSPIPTSPDDGSSTGTTDLGTNDGGANDGGSESDGSTDCGSSDPWSDGFGD